MLYTLSSTQLPMRAAGAWYAPALLPVVRNEAQRLVARQERGQERGLGLAARGAPAELQAAVEAQVGLLAHGQRRLALTGRGQRRGRAGQASIGRQQAATLRVRVGRACSGIRSVVTTPNSLEWKHTKRSKMKSCPWSSRPRRRNAQLNWSQTSCATPPGVSGAASSSSRSPGHAGGGRGRGPRWAAGQTGGAAPAGAAPRATPRYTPGAPPRRCPRQQSPHRAQARVAPCLRRGGGRRAQGGVIETHWALSSQPPVDWVLPEPVRDGLSCIDLVLVVSVAWSHVCAGASGHLLRGAVRARLASCASPHCE